MNQDDIKHLLDLVQSHDLAEFELEDGDFRLRVKRGGPHVVTHVVPAAFPAPPPPAPVASGPTPPAEDGAELVIVKSPIVGTFYRCAEPGAPPFVNVGDTVKKGQVLCIIEAMKLMNEIEAKTAGRVARILVENSQPVEYGQPLFLIDPTP